MEEEYFAQYTGQFEGAMPGGWLPHFPGGHNAESRTLSQNEVSWDLIFVIWNLNNVEKLPNYCFVNVFVVILQAYIIFTYAMEYTYEMEYMYEIEHKYEMQHTYEMECIYEIERTYELVDTY